MSFLPGYKNGSEAHIMEKKMACELPFKVACEQPFKVTCKSHLKIH